jgi:hypothetical protein
MTRGVEELHSAAAAPAQTVHRRWLPLSEEQRAVAAELQRRAALLRDGSEDGLSVRDAVALAARQMGLDS